MRDQVENRCSYLSKSLVAIIVTLPLSHTDAAVLVLSRDYTENYISFFCIHWWYTSTENYQSRKDGFIGTIPDMFVLQYDTNEWRKRFSGRVNISAHEGRRIVCVLVSFVQVVSQHLKELKPADMLRFTPEFPMILALRRSKTFVFLLSVDSSTGNLKLIDRFVYSYSTQKNIRSGTTFRSTRC